MADTESLSLAEIKTQIKSLKVELKTWEHNFLSEKGRKAQKDDIVADKVIAKKYKLYGKLKARMSDINKSSGVDINGSEEDMSQDVVTHVGSMGRPSGFDTITMGRRSGAESEKRQSDRSDLLGDHESPDLKKLRGNRLQDITQSEDGEVTTMVDIRKGVTIEEDEPIQPAAILKNPGVPFKSTHPLLANLTFMPGSDEYTPPANPEDETDVAATATSPKSQTSAHKADAGSSGIPIKTNKSLVDPELFERIPKGKVLRCKIERQGESIDYLYPTYILTNEADEKFILAARKRKKTRYPHYIISSDQDHLNKHGRNYVAKVKSDPSGLAFTILDARGFSELKEKKGLRDLAAVAYQKGTMPHEMKVAVKLPTLGDTTPETDAQDIMRDLITDSSQVLILKNKKPNVSSNGAHGLNFYGRVKLPSIKNFQLVDQLTNTVLLQFGRVGEDHFILDVVHPLSPVEGFGIALTVFDAYDTQ